MPIELWNLTLAALGLIAAAIAAWYAIRGYLLKAGINVRGSYSTTSTVDCDDPFVSGVTLENMKDRAVVIFGIWLELGPGYFLEIERFEANPLIVEPFQVVHRKYDPIQHYSTGSKRAILGPLLQSRDLRGRMLLSIPGGRYRVRTWLPRWDPFHDWINNYSTGMFYPIRYHIDGKAYGSNIAYVARFRLPGGKEEAIPFRERDYEVKLFKQFQLTRESLSSASALEAFLLERAIAGDIKCLDLSVLDLRASRLEVFDDLSSPLHPVLARSPFTYYVLGRAHTWFAKLQMRRANRRTQRAMKDKLASQKHIRAL